MPKPHLSVQYNADVMFRCVYVLGTCRLLKSCSHLECSAIPFDRIKQVVLVIKTLQTN